MHLDDERLERLRHGELEAESERAAREHLAGCPACRALAVAGGREESEIHALLRTVDHPVPRLSAREVAARAGRGGSPWGLRAAAALLALAAAGAAYAAPGSPFPGWVRAAVSRVARPEPPPARRSPAPVQAPEPAGIAVAPGRSLVIRFVSGQVGGRLRVTLGDGAEVQVRAPGGAARFTSTADQLLIDNRGSAADFDLEIPREAPRVEIWIAEERVFLKQGAGVTLDGAAGGSSPYLLPLRERTVR